MSRDPQVLEIAALSLQVTFTALAISMVIGIPLGAWFALTRLRGKRLMTAFIYTGMGLPPVLVGLVVYLFLSRSGPFGSRLAPSLLGVVLQQSSGVRSSPAASFTFPASSPRSP